jgi:hypothetical protein
VEDREGSGCAQSSITFQDDLHNVLWRCVSDTRQWARLRREFEAVLRQHGFAMRRKNDLTIDFVEAAVRGA